MTDFNDFDLTGALDREAFNILNQDNSDLLFGGSSEQEAQVFGSEINANDSVRVGAFLGGVALSNLKTQQDRQRRFNQVRSLQEELRNRRALDIRERQVAETERSNRVGEAISQQRADQDQSQFEITSSQNQQRIDQAERRLSFDQDFASTKFASAEAQRKIENEIARADLAIKQGRQDLAQLGSDATNFIKTYLVEVGGLDAGSVLNATPQRALQVYSELISQQNSNPQPTTSRASKTVVDPNENVTGGGF